MASHDDPIERLRRSMERLREEWRAAGLEDEFDQRVRDYREHGSWPFG